MTLRLGPFDLELPLARGGMGTVWRAAHRGRGLPAAVKVVDGHASEELVGALEHEVRAVAGLDHPHVIRVFDQGRIDGAAARASGDELRPGSPWFAMELADAGRLSWRDVQDWVEIRRSLLALLDALAHAHARGVLHRDLKPANVLFARGPEGRVLKLTDFGMGWSWDPATGAPPRTGGTPQYMAPEQFTGDVVLQGPWTDLYAVGCLAYALVCRRPPYARGSWHELQRAHLETPFPPLLPRVPVPEGFDAFLHGLVAKSPAARFPRAADAAFALASLSDVALEVDLGLAGHGVPDQPTAPHATPSSAPVRDGVADTLIVEAPRASLPPLEVRGPIVAPPMPRDWRHVARPARPVPAGLGLGLFGLRPIPLVGRVPERDVAWAALARVRAERRPRAVVVEGPAGCGKSRLAEWLGLLAEEQGLAVALRATHAPEGGPLHGLPGLVARRYRVSPALERAAAAKMLGRALEIEGVDDPAEADRIAALVRPVEGEGRRMPVERHAVVERIVRRAARDRPAIVFLDDAQWGPDAVAFAERILATDGLPVLLLLTVREEERAAAGDALPAFARHARATVLRLGPLAPPDAVGLGSDLLGLSPELARQLAERTGGLPLYAVQLVGDWVERGLLVPGPDGFRLVEGDGPQPESMAGLWASRVEALVRGRGDAWRLPLEVAAVLGDEVDTAEWAGACAHAGLGPAEGLLARTYGLRLALPDPGSRARFRFVHALFRESVLHAAAEGGRLTRWHRACAEMLGERLHEAGAEERRGRHLLAADLWEDAVPLLLRAIERRVHGGQPREAEALARTLRAELERRVAPDDPRLVELYHVYAQTCRMLGQLDASTALARLAVEHGRKAPPAVRVAALRELAGNLLYTVPATDPTAHGLLDEALAIAEATGDAETIATVFVDRGRARDYHGRFPEAEQDFRRALDRFGTVGFPIGTGDAEVGLASIAYKAGRLDEAEALAGEALARYRAHEVPWRVAWCETLLGEIARHRGDHAAAEAAYRAVIDTYERLVGRTHGSLPRANLGLVLCATGRYAEGRAELERSSEDAGSHVNLRRMIAGLVAWPAAGLRDWAGYDAAIERAAELPPVGIVDPDLGIALREAGRLALAAGEPARARAAFAVAVAFFERLGDEARAAEVRALR